MINEQNLVERAVEHSLPFGRFERLEIQPSAHHHLAEPKCDAVGRLAFGKSVVLDVCFETGSFQSMASLLQAVQQAKAAEAALGCTPLLISSYFSPQKQQFLREKGVGYLDTAGNAWLEAEGLFVDRCGRKQKEVSSPLSQDPFSDKATFVIRLLFSGQALGIRPISTVLAEQGFTLSPGYVSKTIASLEKLHYALKTESGVRLINRELLLQDWSLAYRQKARRRQSQGWYLPEPDPSQLARIVGRALESNGALTDRSGASFIDPHASFDTVDILPSNRDAVDRALERIGATRVARGANVIVHEPVYPLSSFYEIRFADDIPIVSDLQLYLDLRCQAQRGEEAAEHLYRRFIGPLLEEGEPL